MSCTMSAKDRVALTSRVAFRMTCNEGNELQWVHWLGMSCIECYEMQWQAMSCNDCIDWIENELHCECNELNLLGMSCIESNELHLMQWFALGKLTCSQCIELQWVNWF